MSDLNQDQELGQYDQYRQDPYFWYTTLDRASQKQQHCRFEEDGMHDKIAISKDTGGAWSLVAMGMLA